MNYESKISALTGIEENAIKKFGTYINFVHGDDLNFALTNSGNDIAQIDTFEGTILIKVIDNEIKYKFIPSDSFNATVKATIKSCESPLVNKLNSKVVKAISSIYSDLA